MTWNARDLPVNHPMRHQSATPARPTLALSALPTLARQDILNNTEQQHALTFTAPGLSQALRRALNEAGMVDDAQWAKWTQLVTRGIVPLS